MRRCAPAQCRIYSSSGFGDHRSRFWRRNILRASVSVHAPAIDLRCELSTHLDTEKSRSHYALVLGTPSTARATFASLLKRASTPFSCVLQNYCVCDIRSGVACFHASISSSTYDEGCGARAPGSGTSMPRGGGAATASESPSDSRVRLWSFAPSTFASNAFQTEADAMRRSGLGPRRTLQGRPATAHDGGRARRCLVVVWHQRNRQKQNDHHVALCVCACAYIQYTAHCRARGTHAACFLTNTFLELMSMRALR